MAIPNDITFTPFDPLPASQLNDLIENDKALADGSAIGNGAIKAANIDFASIKALGFSSTEQKTEQYWTNNKPIYRRVYSFSALPNNSAFSFAHSITNLDEVIHIYGVATQSDKSTIFPLPSARASATPVTQNQIGIFIGSTSQLTIETGDNRTNFSAKIVIEHTKTTD